jgi:hypothetical protein
MSKIAYNKPYFWEMPKTFPSMAVLWFDWKVRRVNGGTFNKGMRLPFDTGNSNQAYTMMDPKDYDLIFKGRVPQEKLLKLDVTYADMGGVPPVVNQRVVDILTDLCPDSFQAFSVEIRSIPDIEPSYVNTDYFLINITHKVSVVDLEESIFTRHLYSPAISGFKKFRFREDATVPMHLARVAEYKEYMIVSPELRSLFRKHRIRGAGFFKDTEIYL